MSAPCKSGSVLDTLSEVEALAAGGRAALAVAVADYSSQLDIVFAALRRKHFPCVARKLAVGGVLRGAELLGGGGEVAPARRRDASARRSGGRRGFAR